MFEDAYNTYVCDGLPAGAIGNPGLDAILAVVDAPKTNYFYFCSDLETRECFFAETLEEQRRTADDVLMNGCPAQLFHRNRTRHRLHRHFHFPLHPVLFENRFSARLQNQIQHAVLIVRPLVEVFSAPRALRYGSVRIQHGDGKGIQIGAGGRSVRKEQAETVPQAPFRFFPEHFIS